MEVSHGIRRCTQGARRLRVSSTLGAAASGSSHRRITSAPVLRTFATTPRRPREGGTAGPRETAPEPLPKADDQPSSEGLPRHRRGNGPRAIDLSSIATSPDYVPPPPIRSSERPRTSQEAGDKAGSTMDQLLQRQRQSIYDIYGSAGSMSQWRRGGQAANKGPSTGDASLSPSPSPSPSSSSFDMHGLMDNLSLGGTQKSTQQQVQLRLKPTLGRTVDVAPDTGFDLTRAFLTLDQKCNRNSVRADEQRQRTHVRRGQFKKIERRARWRNLFKQGFIAEVNKIRRMQKQGW